MGKEEFLRLLAASLEGEISPSAVQDNVRYYRNYIEEQMRLGRDEEDVLEELGSAQLIAKTIIDSTEAGVDASPQGYDSDPTDHGGRDGSYSHDYTNPDSSYAGGYQEAGPGPSGNRGGESGQPEFRGFHLEGAGAKIAIIAFVVLVVAVLALVVGGVFALVINFWPVFLVLALFSFLFGGRR